MDTFIVINEERQLQRNGYYFLRFCPKINILHKFGFGEIYQRPKVIFHYFHRCLWQTSLAGGRCLKSHFYHLSECTETNFLQPKSNQMEWNGIEKRFNAKHCFYHNLVGCIIFSRTWQTFRCVVVFSSKSFHSSIKFPDNAHIFQCYCNHKLKYYCSQPIQWHCMCSDGVSCSMSNFLFEFFFPPFLFVLQLNSASVICQIEFN